MLSRTPTKIETEYMKLSQWYIGCIACRLDGRHRQDPNPEWIAFHHDSQVGSQKQNCHLHGMGLCVAHHQGVNNEAGLLVRHPPGKTTDERFQERYGTDRELCYINWQCVQRLDPMLKRSLMQHCPFDDLREAA